MKLYNIREKQIANLRTIDEEVTQNNAKKRQLYGIVVSIDRHP